jgi:hypothetical protein
MKLEKVETNGETLPRLTTPARTCNTSDTTAMYQNAGNHKYFVYNFYNAGDCALMIKVLKSRKVGENQYVRLGEETAGPIPPNTQYTHAFNAPQDNGAIRFVVQCSEGRPNSNNCRYNFRFCAGQEVRDQKEWDKLPLVPAGDSVVHALAPSTSANLCLTDEKTLWTFRNGSDADMQIEFSVRNKGLCPFLFKVNGKTTQRDHDTPSLPFTQKVNKGQTFTLTGQCNYSNQPGGSCQYELSGIKIK